MLGHPKKLLRYKTPEHSDLVLYFLLLLCFCSFRFYHYLLKTEKIKLEKIKIETVSSTFEDQDFDGIL